MKPLLREPDIERRSLLVMERTASHQVLPTPLQFLDVFGHDILEREERLNAFRKVSIDTHRATPLESALMPHTTTGPAGAQKETKNRSVTHPWHTGHTNPKFLKF